MMSVLFDGHRDKHAVEGTESKQGRQPLSMISRVLDEQQGPAGFGCEFD